jgi:hypothetical protein
MKEWRDTVFNSFYGLLRWVCRNEVEKKKKYLYLRNPEPRIYGPAKRKRV